MQKRWLNHLKWTLLVSGLCLALLTSALSAAQPASRAFLGVAVGPAAKDAGQAGALIRDLTTDSPAAKAGLKEGDLILKIDDKDVKAPDAVVDAVKNHKAGDKVKLQILRDGKEQAVEATLAERPVEPAMPLLEGFPMQRAAFLGVMAHELTAEVKKELGVQADHGAVVGEVMPNTPAAKAGLKKDDVITEVNSQAVANPEQLRAAIQKLEPGKEATLKIIQGGESREVKVQLQAGSVGFNWPGELGKDWPALKGGRFPFENLPGMDHPEMKRLLQELHQRMQGLDENEANPPK
jgi:S1-C subfamily serine protease